MKKQYQWLAGGLAIAAVAALLAGNGLSLAGSAVAPAQNPAPRGPVIAVLNVLTLTNELDEELHTQHMLKREADQKRAKITALRAALKKMAEPLDRNSTLALKAGTPDFDRQQAKVRKAEFKLEVYGRFSQLQMQDAALNAQEEIYSNIQTTVAAYAKAHGISLVLMTTRVPPRLASQRGFVTMVQTRTVLYASHKLKITSKIASIMNHAWQNHH